MKFGIKISCIAQIINICSEMLSTKVEFEYNGKRMLVIIMLFNIFCTMNTCILCQWQHLDVQMLRLCVFAPVFCTCSGKDPLWPALIACTTTIPDNQWKKDSCNPVNSPGPCSYSCLSFQCLIYFQYLYPTQMLRLFKPHAVSKNTHTHTPSAGSFNSSVADLYLLTFI